MNNPLSVCWKICVAHEIFDFSDFHTKGFSGCGKSLFHFPWKKLVPQLVMAYHFALKNFQTSRAPRLPINFPRFSFLRINESNIWRNETILPWDVFCSKLIITLSTHNFKHAKHFCLLAKQFYENNFVPLIPLNPRGVHIAHNECYIVYTHTAYPFVSSVRLGDKECSTTCQRTMTVFVANNLQVLSKLLPSRIIEKTDKKTLFPQKRKSI